MKKITKIAVVIVILALIVGVVFAFASKDGGETNYVIADAADLLQEDFGIAVTKGNVALMNAVNTVIDEWTANGKMTQYMDYYSALAKEESSGELASAPDGLQIKWDFASATETITVYTESGFAPYEFLYGGEVVGLDIAIMSQVAVNMGKKIDVKDVAFDLIATDVAQADGDAVGAAGISITVERKKVVDFSHIYSSSTLVIVSQNGQYTSVKELAGKNVGVQEGTSGDLIISEAIKPSGYSYKDDEQVVTVNADGASVTQYKQYALAIQDLKNGRIDAILMDKIPAQMNEGLLAETVQDRLYKAFIYDARYKLYFQGLGNTLLIALLATLIGVGIGVVLAMINYVNKKTGKFNILSTIAKTYIMIIRGTPVVLQLFIMYFVVLASSDNGILIGALTFGLNSGAYVAEIVRAGFESVDYGQMEAGRSLGLSTGRTMLKVITPQAVRNVMPPLFNEFITLVKETAIVGYVGILDLGKVPGLIQSRTFDYLFPLLIAACMYLIIVIGLTGILKLIEKQMSKTDRNYRRINVRGKKSHCVAEEG